jgi:hypothetical protein
MTAARLPLWRLIAGWGVLGGFAAVLIYLAPVYVDDFRLYRYIHSLAPASDETLVTEVVSRAHELDLPVRAGDIHVSHLDGRAKVELRYTVKINLAVYPVDLHFPTIR